MKRLVLNLLAVMCVLSMHSYVIADTYQMHVIDASGSMSIIHEGTQDRLSVAKDRAYGKILEQMEGADPVWQGLYMIAGDESTQVPVNGDYDNPIWWTTNEEMIEGTIKTEIKNHSMDVMTPLAESICKALGIVEGQIGTDNVIALYVYTDGYENWSDETDCTQESADSDNVYPFIVNAYSSVDGAGLIWTDPGWNVPERTWNVDGQSPHETTPSIGPMPAVARAYTLNPGPSEEHIDFAAGVEPYSWEWRMYYRTIWGTSVFDQNAGDQYFRNFPRQNADWDWPLREQNERIAVVNIDAIYQLVESTTIARTLTKATPGETGDADILHPISYENKHYRTLNSSTASFLQAAPVVSSSLAMTEDTLFEGLAQLTNGTYTRIPNNQPVPVIGDLDNDKDVDEDDMRVVLKWFGRPVDYYNQPSIDADLSKSDFIDNKDVHTVRSNWTDSNKYPPFVGDTDYNWCVDQSDLNKIGQWYGQTPGLGDQEFHYADLNADGYVDQDDVDLYYNHEGEGCGTNGIPTCTDGIQYGEETDVDCGGTICGGCEGGKTCKTDNDCLSNSCKDNVCENVADTVAATDLVANVDVTSSWSTGYCANLSITNKGSDATTSWEVALDMNDGSVTSS